MDSTSSPQMPIDPHYRMIDVSPKLTTQRRCLAEGRIYLGPIAFEKLRSKTLPKGDALALAEVSGIMAAKNTALLLPLCHPIPIEAVQLSCALEVEARAVRVRCRVVASAKTGVEMEALVGVQAALLCIYDLSKGIDPVVRMGEITLLEKEGGKSGHWRHPDFQSEPISKPESAVPPLVDLNVAVITISDSCAEGKALDRSGAWLLDACARAGARLVQQDLVPDDRPAINQAVLKAIEVAKADLVLTTGGTGLSPRDRTPEALKNLWEFEIPGIGELLRSAGASQTPMSYLSRSGAGIIGPSLLVMLPGSLRAVQQGFKVLLPLLPHAFHVLRGGKHDRPASVLES